MRATLGLLVLACGLAAASASVACGGGAAYCPDSSTCCQTQMGSWSCCPVVNAVCCADHIHCCPSDYPTCTSSGCAATGLTDIPFFVKSFASFSADVEADGNMTIHALINPNSPRGQQHCQQLTVPGGKSSTFWRGQGWRYTSPPWSAGVCPSTFNYVNRVEYDLDNFPGVTWREFGIVTVEEEAKAPTRAAFGPIHASCHLVWTFKADCNTVSTAIDASAVKQKGLTNCDNSEKCGYTVESSNSTFFKATHETPKHHYIDDITISYAPRGSGCVAHAFSTSTIWYAILDDGTNRCNLENLVGPTGLAHTEQGSDNTCTQYSSANCNKY